MSKLTQTSYLVLAPSKRRHYPNEQGVRVVEEFRIDRVTKNRPTTKQSELAVRINLTIDASLFDKISPIVDIELEEGDLFANVATQVAINAEPDEEQ